MKKRVAFTLIELLVVIAIIAILAAILFPVFAQAKAAAKKITCVSNHKQILLATQMYLTDFDDKFHRIRNGAFNSACSNDITCDQVIGAEDMLMPYIKNQGIWKCPSDPVVRDDCTGPGGTWFDISYSFTHHQGGTYEDTDTFGTCAYYETEDSVNGSQMGAPAGTIIMYELWTSISYGRYQSYWRWNNRDIANPAWPDYPQYITINWCGQSNEKITMGIHQSQMNFGFADGHVKSLKRTSIMQWPWDAAAIAAGAKNLIHFSDRFQKS
ncbi:MAG: prepilin-type N-terminal cleavage/methylation domain-containing protein [Fimbriimonadaceae bacterium]|nr:prepilin-type N-terminal cleavage/methylation domain-containing protein [Fimbriimonadaceae bacterium]